MPGYTFWMQECLLLCKAIEWLQVVREGRPCHMYFDLEYIPACNPLIDGEIMVTVLLNLVRMGLRRVPAVVWGR